MNLNFHIYRYSKKSAGLISIFFIIFLTVHIKASIPDGYYDGTAGLSGDSLKAVLHEIINDHVQFPYSSSGIDVWDILKVTDADPASPDSVILFYTGWKKNGPLEYDNGNGWNREHLWAISHGDFGTAPGPGTDVHHLRPTDITVNSARGNKDFADGGSEYIDPDGPTGCYYTDNTWEPRSLVKGDVARSIFYMAVRYEGGNGEPDLELVDYAPSAPNSQPWHGVLSFLLDWHVQDPVDAREENRNDIIYDDYQQNRNPFIDHPEFVELIWNITGSNNTHISSPLRLEIFPNPFLTGTSISYQLPENTYCELNIYNLKGQLVTTLVQKIGNTGNYSILWDGRTSTSSILPAGIYLCVLQTETCRTCQKMIMLK
ncbi:MAG: endonuclease [Candidatus Cloacimonetes bacterium]|nr:endonuclease [Candidatus Cloacimonadota bacterium]